MRRTDSELTVALCNGADEPPRHNLSVIPFTEGCCRDGACYPYNIPILTSNTVRLNFSLKPINSHHRRHSAQSVPSLRSRGKTALFPNGSVSERTILLSITPSVVTGVELSLDFKHFMENTSQLASVIYSVKAFMVMPCWGNVSYNN